jgi:hypothetical protein
VKGFGFENTKFAKEERLKQEKVQEKRTKADEEIMI